MCGRFFLYTPVDVVAERFRFDQAPDIEPRYNISPSQTVPVVRAKQQGAGRELVMLQWGLLPFWAKDRKISYKMINAQSETASEKPAFRAAFKKRRCIIPADGFFEWKTMNKKKQPYVITSADKKPFGFAGLWEHCEGSDNEIIESCTILTTEPNDLIKEIHNRMPVILKPSAYDKWLTKDTRDAAELKSLLIPYPAEDLTVYPVSTLVNKPQNDGPECIAPSETDL